jgi:hypothetical protein
VGGWVPVWCTKPVLCIVPLAISQTHQGAAFSHAVFGFRIFLFLGGVATSFEIRQNPQFSESDYPVNAFQNRDA